MIHRLRAWWHARQKRRHHEAVTKRHGCNIKCPHCAEWIFDHDASDSTRIAEGEYRYVCGHCGGQSEWWFHVAPVPILVTPKVDEAGPLR